MSYEKCIIELIESDQLRMGALRAVKTLELPDWLIAAGFVRNLVWDSLFNKITSISDIDVIYFCRMNTSKERDFLLEKRLSDLEPDLPWSVKNQARMHAKNGDAPYQNTLDAMRFWPEMQTSVGVMLGQNDTVVVRHCFDLSLQFSGDINRNLVRSIETFNSRISSKKWLKTWPGLQVKA